MHKIAQMDQSTGPESYAVVARHTVRLPKKKMEGRGRVFGNICNTKHFYNNKKPFSASGEQNCYMQQLLWPRWKEKHHLFNTDIEHSGKSSA